MPHYAYKHTDGKARACTLPNSAALLRAAYVVPGSVIELDRLPDKGEQLNAETLTIEKSKTPVETKPVISIPEHGDMTPTELTNAVRLILERMGG
jgi:hypothetical protein